MYIKKLAITTFSFLLLCSLCTAGEPLILKGTHKEIGKQHGAQNKSAIKTMINEYLGKKLINGKLREKTARNISTLKQSLPAWYLEELYSCADVAGIDPDVLLYAQCEGDIDSLPGCTTYVAYGQSSSDNNIEFGRNFDYWGIDSSPKCVRTFVIKPNKKNHNSFISIGWAGILGGWTFYNEKGLFIANNLGGYSKKDPKGIPTLILQRILAEKASNIPEAINIIKKLPRMRGQAIILGHFENTQKKISPSAALVLYDAQKVKIYKPVNGFIFHSSMGTNKTMLQNTIRKKKPNIYDAIKSAGRKLTLHSVAIKPSQDKIWIAHGKKPEAHMGKYHAYSIKELMGNN